MKYSCKFVETSVAINDKVDDLLVGILKQIRLNYGIDNDLVKPRQSKSDEKILHPIKEIIKTAIYEESNQSKKKKNNNNTQQQHQTQKSRNNSFKSYKFFSKRQYSDTENIYDIDSTSDKNYTTEQTNIRGLSFFHKIFTHIFKRKSKRLMLQSVENLFTPIAKKHN